MKIGKKFVIFLVAALTCLAAGERLSLANEPGNNTFPGGGNLTNMVTPYEFECSGTNCLFGAGDFGGSLIEINPVGDYDYWVATCGNGIVTSIGMYPVSQAGDLDLAVYKPNGNFIGGSYNWGWSSETVNTTYANMNSVVVMVWGYAGSTGGYSIGINCSAS